MAESENDYFIRFRKDHFSPKSPEGHYQKNTIYKKIVNSYYKQMYRLKSLPFIVDWQLPNENMNENHEGNE